jgi:hypothetical protein
MLRTTLQRPLLAPPVTATAQPNRQPQANAREGSLYTMVATETGRLVASITPSADNVVVTYNMPNIENRLVNVEAENLKTIRNLASPYIDKGKGLFEAAVVFMRNIAASDTNDVIHVPSDTKLALTPGLYFTNNPLLNSSSTLSGINYTLGAQHLLLDGTTGEWTWAGSNNPKVKEAIEAAGRGGQTK